MFIVNNSEDSIMKQLISAIQGKLLISNGAYKMRTVLLFQQLI